MLVPCQVVFTVGRFLHPFDRNGFNFTLEIQKLIKQSVEKVLIFTAVLAANCCGGPWFLSGLVSVPRV